MNNACLILFLIVTAWTSSVFAADDPGDIPSTQNTPTINSLTQKASWWSLDLPNEPRRPRSDVWAPAMSLLLPGLDQFCEHQVTAGALYMGYAAVGLKQMMGYKEVNHTDTLFSSKDESQRKAFLGAQMFQTAGALSAFHSFRSAVETRRSLGEYSFLYHRETSADLLKAPFRFDFLGRTTTWGALGLELILLAMDFHNFKGPAHFTPSDGTYTLAFSYQAGVGEEAIFRGWMMPTATNAGWAPWASNLLTATSFSLAHVSPANPTPWPQFLMGYYLGQVAIWNNWSIQEGIFIHTWWDILAIGATWATLADDKQKALYLPLLDLPISL
jgi:membrane protease YdiL (CAAX protease family)